MEHPFLVEEFTPAHTTHIGSASANRLATAEPQSSAALPPLPNLSTSEVLFLTPSDPQYASYLASANLRTQLSPALRAVCKTEHAVAVMIDWVRSNNLSFGIRCGGHSYEGFSAVTGRRDRPSRSARYQCRYHHRNRHRGCRCFAL